jgi:putative endonuclease
VSAAPRRGWRVYLLRCGDGSLYTGATNDLARRLAAHSRGDGARYTRSRLPVVLVFEERARGRGAALRREAALKQLSRAEKLELVARGRAQGQADEPAPERAGGSGGRELASRSRRERVSPRY